jgi:hypothetical protein
MELVFGAGVDFGPMPLPRRSDFGKSRVVSKKASSFCPAHFYGAVVFFIEEEERRERNEKSLQRERN